MSTAVLFHRFQSADSTTGSTAYLPIWLAASLTLSRVFFGGWASSPSKTTMIVGRASTERSLPCIGDTVDVSGHVVKVLVLVFRVDFLDYRYCAEHCVPPQLGLMFVAGTE